MKCSIFYLRVKRLICRLFWFLVYMRKDGMDYVLLTRHDKRDCGKQRLPYLALLSKCMTENCLREITERQNYEDMKLSITVIAVSWWNTEFNKMNYYDVHILKMHFNGNTLKATALWHI